jgi:ABC-type multidrug transport system fused ATPase/permease subunit
MRRLFREAGSLAWLFVAAALFAVAGSVAAIAGADVLGRALSLIVAQGGSAQLLPVMVSAIVIGSSIVVTTFLGQLCAGTFSERLQRRLRDRIAVRLTHATATAIQREHSGDIMSRMSSDMALTQQLVRTDLLSFASGLLSAVLAAAYMLSRNWFLTLVSVAVTPVLLVVASALSQPLGGLKKASQEALGRANVVARESVSGAQVVRALTMNDSMMSHYGSHMATWLERSLVAVRQVSKLYSIGTALSLAPFVAVFAVGGYMVLAGTIGFGLLFTFVELVNYLSFPIQDMPRLLGSIRSNTAAANRVTELLDTPLERLGGVVGSMETHPLIELCDVTFSYPGEPGLALDHVTLSVARGQKVALVGASGSGKSTVLRLLVGDYQPDTGEARVGGLRTSEWSLAELRRNVALVDQEAFLFDDSVAVNVEAGSPGATIQQVTDALHAASAEFADNLPHGLDTTVGEAGGRISGGQRQRIALARAFIKDAPVIVFDEATSALDNELERQVYADMVRRRPDQTVIAVAHRLTTIRDADVIYVFDEGRIVEHGTHGSLLEAGGKYAVLWKLQQSKGADNV